jgi:hypothetical protein
MTNLLNLTHTFRERPRFFFQPNINYLPMWPLWSCGRRASVVQAQRQIHGVFAGHHTAPLGRHVLTRLAVSIPWLEPLYGLRL